MTDSSSKSDTFVSPGVIAGVAAASVLLLALVLVVLYLNHHYTSVSPFYLIQVSNGLSHIHVDISKVPFKLNTMYFYIPVSHSDARTIGLRGGFRNNSPVTQKWRKVTKKTVLLKLGLAEDEDGNLDG